MICFRKLYIIRMLLLVVMETVAVFLFMQHLHVSPAEVHDWICRDDEYSRLLISTNETSSEAIVSPSAYQSINESVKRIFNVIKN